MHKQASKVKNSILVWPKKGKNSFVYFPHELSAELLSPHSMESSLNGEEVIEHLKNYNTKGQTTHFLFTSHLSN